MKACIINSNVLKEYQRWEPTFFLGQCEESFRLERAALRFEKQAIGCRKKAEEARKRNFKEGVKLIVDMLDEKKK